MAETSQIAFTFKEIAEALLKKQGIHEGHWAILVKFGIEAKNVTTALKETYPTALVPILELGIQRFGEPNPLSVDASIVNPSSSKKRGRTKRSKTARRR
ncbi:MAG: hypothetical protein HY650_02585 [Acidobacteria bacterium]|nr:hypothetical protein [Acidobacteriota bacterium]